MMQRLVKRARCTLRLCVHLFAPGIGIEVRHDPERRGRVLEGPRQRPKNLEHQRMTVPRSYR